VLLGAGARANVYGGAAADAIMAAAVANGGVVVRLQLEPGAGADLSGRALSSIVAKFIAAGAVRGGKGGVGAYWKALLTSWAASHDVRDARVYLSGTALSRLAQDEWRELTNRSQRRKWRRKSMPV
jgi:hypothetical protein